MGDVSQNTQADAPPPRVSFRDVSVRIARSRHALDRRARYLGRRGYTFAPARAIGVAQHTDHFDLVVVGEQLERGDGDAGRAGKQNAQSYRAPLATYGG